MVSQPQPSTSTPTDPGRFTGLPDEQALAQTMAGLEGRGLSAELVEDLDAARSAVLGRIPQDASIVVNPSVTLEEAGIAQEIQSRASYQQAMARVMALDRETQLQEIKAIMGQPDFSLGSVHAITRDGVPVIASALGSQLAAYSWGAAKVILVAGAQKLVADLAEARERITEHCLPLENARVLGSHGKPSYIGKILEIHQDDPGRIHVVLIRRAVGF